MAPGYKRKRDDEDQSDDEQTPGYQVLPVANLPEDFDGEPLDGMQYLFTVRRNARTLPKQTQVPNPFPLPEVPEPTVSALPHPSLPSENWRNAFEKGFKNFRKNIIQPTIHIHLPQRPGHRIMPDKRQRDCWWLFISGRPESEWNPPKMPKSEASVRRDRRYGRQYSPEPVEDQTAQETWHINNEGEVELAMQDDAEESLPTPSGTPPPSGLIDGNTTSTSQAQTSREPTPSVVSQLDHRTSLHLLMYFTHWITLHLEQPADPSTQMTETHARWIFVLLSCIEDFISADDMNLLRNLARASLAFLKRSKQQESHANDEHAESLQGKMASEGDVMSDRSCWIILTAVAGFWGQRDLWMEAEAMLVSIGIVA